MEGRSLRFHRDPDVGETWSTERRGVHELSGTSEEIPELLRRLAAATEDANYRVQIAVNDQLAAIYSGMVGERRTLTGFADALYSSTTGQFHRFLGPESYGHSPAVEVAVPEQDLEILGTTPEGVAVRLEDGQIMRMPFGSILPEPQRDF